MTEPGPTKPNEHPEDLLLSYLEESLYDAQRAMVEEHLSSCARCSDALDGIKQTIATLRETPEALCAEPWELYEYVHYGHDPDGVISQHVKHCAECRANCQSMLVEREPQRVTEAVVDAARPVPHRAPAIQSWWSTIIEGVLSTVRSVASRPALAAGAVAAAVFAMVVLHPWSVPPYLVSFSGVDWKEVPKPKAVPVSGRTTTVVVVWKDWKTRPSQNEVDALYTALAPTMDVYERVGVVVPDALRAAARRNGPSSGDRESLLSWLGKDVHVQSAVLVTISPVSGELTVNAELVDIATGVVRARKIEHGRSVTELLPRIRESVTEMFVLAGQPKQTGDRAR